MRAAGRLLQLEHARREFIANASHELRTPLFSLAGSLELLVDEEMDDATWLSTCCGSVRSRLRFTESFDRDALLYRRTVACRRVFASRINKTAKDQGWGATTPVLPPLPK